MTATGARPVPPTPAIGPPAYAGGGWQLTRHADVSAALGDDRLVVPTAPPGPPGTIAGLRATVARFCSGDPHTRRRALVTAELRGLDPDELRRQAYEMTVAELARAVGGRLDVMSRLARRVPVGVLVGRLGGDPAAAVPAVTAAAAAYLPGTPAGREQAADAAVARLAMLLPDGPDEVVANRIGLLIQACDATAGLIGGALRHALREPAPAWSTVSVLAETLRYDPPVRLTRRQAREPLRIGAAAIDAGSTVALWFDTANRDPAVFPDPDRFDPDRGHGRVLTFGAGPRACPGDRHALALAAGVVDAVRECCRPARDVDGHEPSPNTRVPLRLEVLTR